VLSISTELVEEDDDGDDDEELGSDWSAKKALAEALSTALLAAVIVAAAGPSMELLAAVAVSAAGLDDDSVDVHGGYVVCHWPLSYVVDEEVAAGGL
jgi:hypothetical protein